MPNKDKNKQNVAQNLDDESKKIETVVKTEPVVESNNLSPIIPETEQPAYKYDWFGEGNKTKTPEAEKPKVGETKQVEKPKVDETEQIEIPKETDYDYHTKLTEQLYGNDYDSPEEVKKRQRSAYAMSAIGALGNAVSALSNVVFTGKGAPSQVLPKIDDKAIQAYEDKYRKKRADYLNAKAVARGKDRADYNSAVSMYLQNKKVSADNAYKRMNLLLEQQKLGMVTDKDKWEREYKEAELAFKKSQAEAAQASEKYKNTTDRIKANAMATYYENGGRGGKSGESIPIQGSNGKYIRINGKDWGRVETVRQVYDMLPEDIRAQYDNNIRITAMKKPEDVIDIMRDAIGVGLAKSPEAEQYLINSGVGKYVDDDKTQSQGSSASEKTNWDQYADNK